MFALAVVVGDKSFSGRCGMEDIDCMHLIYIQTFLLYILCFRIMQRICVMVEHYFWGGCWVVGVPLSRIKYVHCPSTGFSSKSSHLHFSISNEHKSNHDVRLTL